MNKLFYICIFWIGLCFNTSAQNPEFQVNSSNNYTSIHTYNGVISQNAYELKLSYSGTNLNFPNWKIAVRLIEPIKWDGGNLVIPPDKVSLVPTHTTGSLVSMNLPSIAQIGVNPGLPFVLQNEVTLVPKSNVAFTHTSQYNSYSYLQIHYNLKVEGGAYLEALQGGDNQKRYIMKVEFITYNERGVIVGRVPQTYTIDIFRLSGTPPVANVLNIQVATGAKNALLELQTINDYRNGASVNYTNGLSVLTNTNYELKVRSLNAQFNNIATSATLPLDVISLELIPTSSSHNSTPSKINLSNSPQKVLEGYSTLNQTKTYNMKYATQGGDQRLIQTPIGQYRTILEYQIIPK